MSEFLRVVFATCTACVLCIQVARAASRSDCRDCVADESNLLMSALSRGAPSSEGGENSSGFHLVSVKEDATERWLQKWKEQIPLNLAKELTALMVKTALGGMFGDLVGAFIKARHFGHQALRRKSE